MSSGVYSNGYEVDGSWVLRIYVTDLNIEKCLRVKGELHIGGVMLRLVETCGLKMDWSDHALWWPVRNQWLARTRSTLDQYGVAADAILHFTPMHKLVRIQLPDMRYIDHKVDFSVKTFNAVVNLCKELGIRHPEELSFCKPLEPYHLKYNWKDLPVKKGIVNNKIRSRGPADVNTFISPTHSPCNASINFDQNTGLEILNGSLNDTFGQSSFDSRTRIQILRPRNLVEKARTNVTWLDSSLSIMEQGIQEFDTLRLRFKFYAFYDLNPKVDVVRINMIYEQARWQLLSEEITCTEEEALMFAALQIQVNVQASMPQVHEKNDQDSFDAPEDDIDAALTDLQVSLEGSNLMIEDKDITQVPELSDYLRFLKPKRFTLRAFKRYWFVCRDMQLRIYRNHEDAKENEAPVHLLNLKGSEVTPDIHLGQNRYGIRLEVPGSDGMSEIWIRCDTESQYARWLAACRLAAKGRSLADASYESEVEGIMSFLQLQRPALAPVINPKSLGDIVPEEYIAPKFAKKLKAKLTQRILEAHANVKDLSLIDAKLNYIKAWQSLPDYGITLFVVRFAGKNKDELLGVASNRLMRMDLHSGDHIKTWRFNTMKAWNINWEVKQVMVQFEEEEVIFECKSADCKILHEFIGGYIFLSMRSKESNQSLNEEMFHKLTGGWD